MEIRERFEALPDIKIRLIGMVFCFSKNEYIPKNKILIEVVENTNQVNLAWYAFQEQEKKVSALEKELEMRKQGAMVMSHHRDEVLSICTEYWCDNDRDYNIYIQRIEELLK